ncbi:putative D-xylulose reductase A [Colletotrichum sidae]|uniref:L-arabinitol 4-dehydrogenase n=3 Tax=Colletotrichum orbiculare species complex TaxID=2707354 RepID=A0A4R8QZH1_COLTR|nr:putative D-xylulose reductase A [Colletotrichum spinosum]TDZ47149.1 putative D-xylulose reductase A [Colletotrichum trifolii]TEA20664.1 putative D-xylulose reductase A [Colletotrichum sidae]
MAGTEGKSNLSFILNKPHDVEFADRPIPKLSDPHNVLVAINYTGICGSDVHYWEHGAIGHFVVKDPMVLGHESAGTVVEVGDAVKTLKVGDRIALEPGYPCRRCEPCLAGHYNLCPDMRFAATPPYDGTLTGFWSAPADFCFKLPDNVSLQEGALIEPLAVAVHITKQARITPGSSVVVMGAGPVGLLCAAVAKAFGATKVVSVDIVQSKLDFAKELASTHTYLSQRISAEDNAKALIEQCGLGEGADAVIDASGAEPSIQTSLHVVRMGGTYVQGGMGKADINFPIMALCLKEVTARGSFRYGPGDYKLAIDLVANGSVNVKKLITGIVSFKQAEEAFKKVKEGQVIKILIAGPNEKVESELSTSVDASKTTSGSQGGCC